MDVAQQSLEDRQAKINLAATISFIIALSHVLLFSLKMPRVSITYDGISYRNFSSLFTPFGYLFLSQLFILIRKGVPLLSRPKPLNKTHYLGFAFFWWLTELVTFILIKVTLLGFKAIILGLAFMFAGALEYHQQNWIFLRLIFNPGFILWSLIEFTLGIISLYALTKVSSVQRKLSWVKLRPISTGIIVLLLGALLYQNTYGSPVIKNSGFFELRYPQRKDCYTSADGAIFKIQINTKGGKEEFDFPVEYIDPKNAEQIRVMKGSYLPLCTQRAPNVTYIFLNHFPMFSCDRAAQNKRSKTCDLDFLYKDKIHVGVRMEVSDLPKKADVIKTVSSFLDTFYVDRDKAE